MVKFHEDFVRYDFFYNCTDVLWVHVKQPLPEPKHNLRNPDQMLSANGTDIYPVVWDYISKQFNTVKYDVLHVFQDFYQIYEKSIQIVSEDSSDYEDQTPANASNSGQSSDKKDAETLIKTKGFSDMIKKAVVGVGSFLFIGILKLICSLDCVKNMMKETDVDDDKAKELRSRVGNVVNKNIANTFGFGDDE